MKTHNTLFLLFLVVCSIACKNQSCTSDVNTTPAAAPMIENKVIPSCTSDANTTPDTIPAAAPIIENKITPLKIREGRRVINNYEVRYNVCVNDIIASIYKEYDEQTGIVLDSSFFYNHTLFLTAYYKNQIIINNLEIKSSSFDGIENPDQFVFIPASYLDFDSINDTLVVSTEMSVVDTDWGYALKINISPKGDVSYMAQNNDDLYFE